MSKIMQSQQNRIASEENDFIFAYIDFDNAAVSNI